MNKKLISSCCILPLLISAAAAAQAQESWADQLSKAVTDGKASLDLRYRYEYVDQDGFDRNAKASTLRSRVTLATAPINGFSGLLEFDDLTAIGADDYNSTVNGKTQYPVIADPEGTGVNQAWLKWAGSELSGTYGRQRILHSNQRFIGGVAWRQNEQTYDGFRAIWKPSEDFKMDLSYVYNVDRIFGPDDGANPASLRGDNIFFRLDYTMFEGHSINGYAYSMEFDQQRDFAAGKTINNSNETYGIEYSGKFDWFSLNAAVATQSEAGDSELDYSTNYYMIEAAGSFKTIGLKAGYEVLGGDDGVGFKTPLATLHKFQGWADKFLGTPGDGIEDLYLSASGKLGSVKLAAIYHDFQAEDSGEDFGNEWDLVATWPINKQFTVLGKYAAFSSDSDRFDDTDKAWISLQLKL